MYRKLESFAECMDIFYVANMAIILYQLNILLVLFHALSCKSTTSAPSIRSMLDMKKLITTISSTDGRLSMQTPWTFEGSGFVLLIRKRLNYFDVSSTSVSFPCKWRANTPKRQRLSLYGFFMFCS